MKLSILILTYLHIHILPVIAKGRKQVMKILMIFNVRVSTNLWLSIKLNMLTLEELFPSFCLWRCTSKYKKYLCNWYWVLGIIFWLLWLLWYPCYCGYLWRFIDTRGSLIYSLQVPFESITIFVDPLDNFLDTFGSPFFSVNLPSRYHFLLWTVTLNIFNLSDSCECLLVPNGWLLLHFNYRVLYIGYFPHDSLWLNPQHTLTSQIFNQVCTWTYPWVSPSLSIFTLPLPSRCHWNFILVVSVSWYYCRYPKGDDFLAVTISQSEALLPASLCP